MITTIALSLWGIAVVVLLFAAGVALFYVIDRKTMAQLLRILLFFVLSMLIIAGYLWGLSHLRSWWADALWGTLVAAAVASLILKRAKLWNRQLPMPVFCAVWVGIMVAILLGMLLLPHRQPLFIPALIAMQAASMLSGVADGLRTYIHSLRHTQTHYQYLLANDASHLEAILPNIRRTMRATIMPSLRLFSSPLVILLPLLLCGLLMAGVEPLTAVLFVVLLNILVFGVNMLTMVLIILFADRLIFDRSGRFLL